MKRCQNRGIDVYRYGADLPDMANVERKKNIWAVRFLYWHIVNKGLCLRPPWSMVEHIGWDSQGTNAQMAGIWADQPLKPCPLVQIIGQSLRKTRNVRIYGKNLVVRGLSGMNAYIN